MKYFYIFILLSANISYGQTFTSIQQLFIDGDYSNAINAGKLYLRKYPQNPDVYRIISKSYYRQKKLDSAGYFWEKGFSFDSVFSPDASVKLIANTLGRLRRLAEIHLESGDTSLGISELYTVLRIKPPMIRADSTKKLLLSLGCNPDSAFRGKPQWKIIKGKQIDYYFEDTIGPHALLQGFISRYETAFDILDTFFQADLSLKIRCFVYLDKISAAKELGEDLAPNAHPASYEINTGFLGYYPAGHEITHILVVYAWGIAPAYIDRFVNEGLAVAFDLDGEKDKMALARKVLAREKFRSVHKVWEQENTLEKQILYPVAGAFIQFLYRNSSTEDFKRLIKLQTYQGAVSIYGKDRLKKLMHDFDIDAGLIIE